MPVTVTVCATFQLALVKVNSEVLTAPSNALLTDTGIVTSAVGAAARTTVKVAVAPASLVLPLMVPTLIAAAILVATAFCENSEVPPKLPPPKSNVAVALTARPAATLTPDSSDVKKASPPASVVTLTKPRNTWPSP